MSILQNTILATIAYYDIFDFPLTFFEVNKYLINPKRLSGEVFSETFSLGLIVKELEKLESDDTIGSKNGFYFLPGREGLCELRIDREKISAQKWKNFLKTAKWFQAVPYLRMIFASGSLAINNTNKESDFDVLSVVKSGRLYLCRIFLSFMASLFGTRRTRFDVVAPDKFCFNHYITDRSMNIKHKSLFNAQTYINLKPVFVKKVISKSFYDENFWLNEYVYNFEPTEDLILRSIAPNPILVFLGQLGEFVLDSPLGDKLEDWAKRYQQKRIRENPATYESGGRVIFTDDELEFHPRSFEAFAIDRYNKKLKELGIVSHTEEKDSGLNA